MCKAGHFDIGTWAKEKKRLTQEAVGKNHTISSLKDDITQKEDKIKDLKRKVSSYLYYLSALV